MIKNKIRKLLDSKPYLDMSSVNNCGTISSFIIEDLNKDIDEINMAEMVKGSVTDENGNTTLHYFVYIPEESHTGSGNLIVDGTIDQFTYENKQKIDNIKSAFYSKEEYNQNNYDDVFVCDILESPYNHNINI